MRHSARRLVGSIAVVAFAASLSAATSGAASASTSAAAPKYKLPKVYGTSFQADPKHDFTKRIHTRRDGILRGWVTAYHGGVAEYEPVKWVSGKLDEEGAFTGPKEGEVFAYASPLARKAVLYSVTGCAARGTTTTADRRGLGTKRCSRKGLLAHLKAGHRPAMITVHKGQIVKIQEINHP